jgi:hypothetical protein
MDDRFPARSVPWIDFEPEGSPYLQHARQAVAQERTVRLLVDRKIDKLYGKLHDKLADKVHGKLDHWRYDRELNRTIDRELRGPLRTEGRPEQWMHDKLVREVYADVRREVEARGGEVLCRRSELWLKQQVGRACVRVRDQHGKLTDKDRERIAEEFHLKVVDGRIQVPDFQVWIEDRHGEKHLGNVEVASPNYHRKLIATKQRAGFHVVHGGDVRGRRIRNGPDIVRNIISR